MRYFATAILVANLAVSAAAEEKSIRLKEGAGLDKVESNCNACHSLDYVPMNSPILNAAGWDAKVAKMINVFGAPIDEQPSARRHWRSISIAAEPTSPSSKVKA